MKHETIAEKANRLGWKTNPNSIGQRMLPNPAVNTKQKENNMKTYLTNTTVKIHDMIQLCPVDCATTSKLLDILDVVNEALKTITNELPAKP